MENHEYLIKASFDEGLQGLCHLNNIDSIICFILS